MADQQSDHASITAVVGTFYSKKILQDFEASTVFYESAPVKEPIPVAGGKTINFDRYKKVDALYKDDSDEFTAQQLFLSAQSVTATLHERDGYIQLSRYTVLTARGRALDRAAEKIKFAAAKTLDKLCRNDIGCAIADKAVYSGNMFVRVLAGNDVPPLSDGNFRLICHPDVAYQITTNAGFKGWTSPTSSEAMKTSPIRRDIVAGASIQTSTLGLKFPVSGDTLSTSSGNVYGSLLFGDEAYGCSEVSGEGGAKGFQFFLKQSGPTTVSDPTNKKKQAAFSITAVAKVLNKSAGIWIWTTGT